jgi:hypothetical protein
MRVRRLIGFAAAVTSCACATGIQVTRVTSPVNIQKGNPWNLPMTQFTASITRHIIGCGSKITGKVEVLPVSTIVVDEAQRYVLRSNGNWATSDITSTLAPSGISTGLNAQSTDATATVISNVIGAAAQVAIGFAAGAAPPPPPPPRPGEPPPPPPVKIELCRPAIAAAVDELYPPKPQIPLKTQIDAAIAELELATAQVALLTAQTTLDASLKPKLVTALGDQAKRQAELKVLQTKLADDLQLTSDVQVVTWPLQSSEFRTAAPFELPSAVFAKWATASADSAAAKAQFAVSFALYRRDSVHPGWQPAEAVMGGAGHVDVDDGVPVRIAQVGRLLSCVATTCPTTAQPEGPSSDANVTANELPILQLGQIYMVPVAGGTFRSESAVIALDANGLPTSIQVSKKVAAAASASGAAKDAATQLGAVPGQIDAARLARTQAQTGQLTANAALATAQANAGIQGQTTALAAQTALINAQTNLATAQANAGLPLQTAAATAQAALLNAQAALANAQASAQNVDQTSAWTAQASLANAQAAQINAAAALAKALAGTP